MDEENYMTDRVDDQITWYNKRSGQYQRRFKQIRIWQIIFASSIPFLTGLLKPQQLWTDYRTTAETLKHQKYLYQTQTAPYDEEDAFHLFVENIENIISKENSHWAQQMSKKKDEQKHDRK